MNRTVGRRRDSHFQKCRKILNTGEDPLANRELFKSRLTKVRIMNAKNLRGRPEPVRSSA